MNEKIRKVLQITNKKLSIIKDNLLFTNAEKYIDSEVFSFKWQKITESEELLEKLAKNEKTGFSNYMGLKVKKNFKNIYKIKK